jgi:hypothetical protein
MTCTIPTMRQVLKTVKREVKAEKISGSIVQSPNPLLHSLTDQAVDRQKSAGATFFPYQPFSRSTSPVVLSSFLTTIPIVPPFLSVGPAGGRGKAADSRGKVAVSLKRSPPKLGRLCKESMSVVAHPFFCNDCVPSLLQWPHLITGINRR